MSTATATPADRLGAPAAGTRPRAARTSAPDAGTSAPVARLVPALAPPPAAVPRPRPAAPGVVVPATPSPGASGPVVERLGAARIASYRHRAPADAPARPRAAPPLPPGTVPGVAAHLDPRQACCMLALAAVEVLAGRRPIAQLARWLHPEVYDALSRRAALTAPPGGTARPEGAPTAPARRASVRRVRVCRVDAHVVESSVVVAHGDRVRAVAVRLTRASGWWRASALVVG